MQAAAVAVTHGLDPLAFLRLAASDAVVVLAALEEAGRLRAQRENAYIRALSESTAVRTVQHLRKALR